MVTITQSVLRVVESLNIEAEKKLEIAKEIEIRIRKAGK